MWVLIHTGNIYSPMLNSRVEGSITMWVTHVCGGSITMWVTHVCGGSITMWVTHVCGGGPLPCGLLMCVGGGQVKVYSVQEMPWTFQKLLSHNRFWESQSFDMLLFFLPHDMNVFVTDVTVDNVVTHMQGFSSGILIILCWKLCEMWRNLDYRVAPVYSRTCEICMVKHVCEAGCCFLLHRLWYHSSQYQNQHMCGGPLPCGVTHVCVGVVHYRVGYSYHTRWTHVWWWGT